VAGRQYVYRLVVDIPGKGRKELGVARAEASLAPPAAGRIASVGPNPSRGQVLFSVTVPAGPRPGVADVNVPSGSGGLRGEQDGTDDPSFQPLWRDVQVRVHDVRGRAVADLGTFRHREFTTFTGSWDGHYGDGAFAPPGVYFLSIDLGYESTVEKLVLLR
jgi:hypothetical protein